jgi:ATP phosphoribosyltransferase regulatory subunit
VNLIERASEALIARGGAFVDLPMLLPASLVLELAGEGLRPRLFFANAPDGSELCLRADLTIPAALHYVARSEYDNDPFAWACKGPVFRAPRGGEDRPPEFVQIGLERFGDTDIVSTDVTIFLAAWDACKAAEVSPLFVRFCDGGLMPKIIADADLPGVWREALAEQAPNPRAFLAILAQASSQTQARDLSDLERRLVDLPFEDALIQVEQALARGDLTLVGERTLNDVTARLMTRARRTLAKPLEREIAQTLYDLATFTDRGTNNDTLDHVCNLALKLNVDLSAWRQDWQARFDAIKAGAPESFTQCRFDALGEEAFDYYDGMAFDIATSPNFERPVATGGRYDRLIGEISGGSRQARAIGCVVRPDRFGRGLR